METSKQGHHKKTILFIAVFFIVNILGVFFVSMRASSSIDRKLLAETMATSTQFEAIMSNYE